MITQSCTSKRRLSSTQQIPSHEIIGAPYGTRTRVTAVKGRCPGPLDEGRIGGRGEAATYTFVAPPKQASMQHYIRCRIMSGAVSEAACTSGAIARDSGSVPPAEPAGRVCL